MENPAKQNVLLFWKKLFFNKIINAILFALFRN